MASSISLAHQASLRISSPSQSVGRFNGARSSSVRVSCFHSPSIGHPLQLSRSLNMRCAAASPETLKKVVDIVTKQLAATEGSVKPESKFEELGADSLDQVEIVMALEEDFEISIDEQGSEAIKTVQDAADLIEKTKSVKVDA